MNTFWRNLDLYLWYLTIALLLVVVGVQLEAGGRLAFRWRAYRTRRRLRRPR